MEAQSSIRSHKVLFFNTLAFTICFAVWMLNGVLITFLVDNQVYKWTPSQIGWLLGVPVLTGSIFRLPLGMLTDRYGGRIVFGLLLIIVAVPMYMLSTANSYIEFIIWGFGFGFAGTSFAVGIASTSIWYKKEHQGTALGIFGAGNAGAALTTLFAPTLLKYFTQGGTNIEGWRTLPKLYAAMLVIMGIAFLLFTHKRVPEGVASKNMAQRLAPLKDIRVWRFGLYYFLVFGCFVAFSQWLVPYFVNVYYLPLVTAGIFAALFSFPSGVIRALGGWMSDKWGARSVMYWVLGMSVIVSMMLSIPRMDIFSPGPGIMAKRGGVVTAVSETSVQVDDREYKIKPKPERQKFSEQQLLILPQKDNWQEIIVKVGDKVNKKELLAKGITRIHFQANVWIYAILAILIGSIWGIGKAAVYKHIPVYFPNDVGVVGGMVGVLGGLGGFICPVIFGYLLEWTGLWSSCWVFMFLISVICIFWMHRVIQKMMREKAPELMKNIESVTGALKMS